MNTVTPDSIRRARRSLAVGALTTGLAAALAAAALTTSAEATSNSALFAQAKAGMQREDAAAEKHHTIPFKSGTKFTINCGFKGVNILCTEHAGPEKCVKGKPWILLSDLFPVIKGRVGESLTYDLTWTAHYCPSS
jgi:hypothetical protein